MGVEAGRPLKEALFPTCGEIFALMVLFVCEWGYNGAVLNSMTVNAGRADDGDNDGPVHLVEMDKPRRGTEERFFSNTFTGKHAVLWEQAVSLSQPARDTLSALGHPTDKLFIAAVSWNRSSHPTGMFRTDWSGRQGAKVDAWNHTVEVTGDDGHPLRVTLSRLRLSEQVLNDRTSQNTETVSASVYRYPDPQTHARAREIVLQGQADALEHARATVQMRTITEAELAASRIDPDGLAQKLKVAPEKIPLLAHGRLDTATGACLNYDSSPFAEPVDSCRASFLNCFACPNAVATPAHPAQTGPLARRPCRDLRCCGQTGVGTTLRRTLHPASGPPRSLRQQGGSGPGAILGDGH